MSGGPAGNLLAPGSAVPTQSSAIAAFFSDGGAFPSVVDAFFSNREALSSDAAAFFSNSGALSSDAAAFFSNDEAFSSVSGGLWGDGEGLNGWGEVRSSDGGWKVMTFASSRRACEPASFCRRYPPNVQHSAEGAIKPLFRPTLLQPE